MVNPRAGGGRCAARAPAVLERLRDLGFEVEVHQTAGTGGATEIARRAFRGGARDFAALGGDGTAYEVLNGVLPESLDEGERCRLALFPLGTGNSFVRHFLTEGRAGRDAGAALALEAVEHGRTRRCDALRLDHSAGSLHALGTVSLGFASTVADRVNRSLKPLGVLGYTLGVLAELTRLPAPRLRATVGLGDGRLDLDHDAIFAAAQNVAYTGGTMRMAPGADPGDGVAELVTLRRVGRLELLRAFPRLFRGDHVDHPAVDVHRFDRLELRDAPPQLVMLDGEVATLEPRAIEVVAGALDVWI